SRRTAELMAEFTLGTFEPTLLRRGKVLPSAVDVEIQHRHGRLKGRALAPLAALGRALQRCCDSFRIACAENALLEVEGVAPRHNLRRPFPRLARSRASLWRAHSRPLMDKLCCTQSPHGRHGPSPCNPEVAEIVPPHALPASRRAVPQQCLRD